VKWDKEMVDAAAARMVNRPASLDTILATNLHADILSDLAAALAGSLGIGPTANINPERVSPSMFEPIHGSAFDIMGKGVANPVGTFWTAVMMLEHLGEMEAARRLIQSGHDVGFLGLIDSRRSTTRRQERRSILAKASGYLGRTWRRPRQAYQQAYRDALWWLTESLTRNCRLSVLRKINGLVTPLPGAAAFTFRLELLARLRSVALEKWTVEPLEVPATLFRSDEYSASAPDYGWGALCKQLVVRPISGGHRTLLQPEFRETLCAQFLRAVKTAGASKRTGMIRTGS